MIFYEKYNTCVQVQNFFAFNIKEALIRFAVYYPSSKMNQR